MIDPIVEQLKIMGRRQFLCGTGMGLGRWTRLLERHGFEASRVYAPIPDELRPRAVIPVEDQDDVLDFLHESAHGSHLAHVRERRMAG